MQFGISLKGQNFTSSLVENDISSSMQLTKGRPYLIFWLGQVCFDAVKARQNDQVLCWTSDRYFFTKLLGSQLWGGEWVFHTAPKWDGNQAGWEGRADCKSLEKIWDSWRQWEVCLLGFCFLVLQRILPCWFWGSLRKSYQLCLTKPLLPLDR